MEPSPSSEERIKKEQWVSVDSRDLALYAVALREDGKPFLANHHGCDDCINWHADYSTGSCIAKHTSERVHNEYLVLYNILERYEEKVRARWMKKSRQQRKKLLLAAWPDMHEHHRPDLRYYSAAANMRSKTKSANAKFVGFKAFEAFAMPSINQEDLTHAKPFLLLLHSRGRHHPSEFASADLRSFEFGMKVRAFSVPSLPDYTMMMQGQRGTNYGKLLSWEKYSIAEEYYRRGLQPSFGEGLLILIVQEHILRFLVDICASILQDTPLNLLKGPPESIQLAPPDEVQKRPTNAKPSLTEIIAETPYRVPPKDGDMQRLLTIVASKRASVVDEIFTLREDPGYFSEFVRTMADHRPETLPCWKGPAQKCDSPKFWQDVLESVIQLTYFAATDTWQTVQDLLSDVIRLHQQYGGGFSWKSPLPDRFLHATVRLIGYLYREIRLWLCHLRKWLPASPPMRSKFVQNHHAWSCGCCGSAPKGAIKPSEIIWVFWLMRDVEDEEGIRGISISDLMDEWDRRLRQDPKQKALITPLVDDLFSGLAIMAECIRQLEMTSYSRQLDVYFEAHKEEVDDEIEKLGRVGRDFDKQLRKMELAEVGRPLQGFFHYPVDKRRTRETTEQIRLAEARLDAFWRRFDEGLSGSTKEVVASISPTADQLQRTPEWVEPPSSPSKNAAKPVKPEPLYVPFLRLDVKEEPASLSSEEAPSPPTARQKVKTRGVPTPARDPWAFRAGAPAPELTGFAQRNRVPVSKRALEAFSFLFPTPAAYTTPSKRTGGSELPWIDFLAAMESAGFTPQKLHGSAWQFTASVGACPGGTLRTIQFHEPHPAVKIPFLVGRRMGRRLQRAFGWSFESFVVAEKSESESNGNQM